MMRTMKMTQARMVHAQDVNSVAVPDVPLRAAVVVHNIRNQPL